MIFKLTLAFWRIGVLACLLFIAYCANTSLQGWPLERLVNMVTPEMHNGHAEEPAAPKDGACAGLDCIYQKDIDKTLDDKVKRATP